MSKKDRPAARRSTSGNTFLPYEPSPPLSIAGHIKLAAALKNARQALCEAYPSFPKQGQLTPKILRFDRALAELKCELDSRLVALVPAKRDPRGLATRVYYGARLIPRYRPPDDPTDDAFADWREMSELTERKP
jgi:hypothetical protein